MSGSQGSAASASSSSAQPPQPVQQLPEPNLELEGELIDADTANTEVPEPGDTQSRLQHALAALCLRHKPSETIEPRMLRVFLDRVVPDAYRIQPKDTLLAMLMHKHFSIHVSTTREAVGKTSPSKHETSYAVQYRNLCIVGPDPKYNTDRTFAEESEERLRVHYMYLKSILSTHPDSTIRELKWTQSDVVTWFKEAKIKKRSKKVVTCNVQFPPLSFIHVPFEVLRVIINDAFCESPHATIHSALRATITGAHVVEVFGEKDGWRVWDQAPSGTWEKVGTPPDGAVFRTDQQPTYHAHGVLWGIEFLLAPAPKPSSEGAPKRQRLTILGAWLQAKGEGQGQVGTAEAPLPLPKLGMHCVGSSSALFFALMSSISAALAARAQPPAPAAVPISSGRLAELGSGNPSAGSSAGASNPSPATPALWEAPAVGGAQEQQQQGPPPQQKMRRTPRACRLPTAQLCWRLLQLCKSTWCLHS